MTWVCSRLKASPPYKLPFLPPEHDSFDHLLLPFALTVFAALERRREIFIQKGGEKHMKIQKSISSILAVAGMTVMGMGVAHADIIPVFLPGAVTTSGGITTFTYRVDVTNDQQVAPPSSGGFNVNNDSFTTIYDFAGFVPGSFAVTSGSLSTSVQNVGVTPSLINAQDNATIPNLTVYYTGGSTLAGPQTLGFVTAQTTLTGFNPSGFFAGQAQKNEGLSKGTTIDNIGRTTVPIAGPSAVPEPASLVPFMLGGLGLLGLIARKTRRTSGAAA